MEREPFSRANTQWNAHYNWPFSDIQNTPPISMKRKVLAIHTDFHPCNLNFLSTYREWKIQSIHGTMAKNNSTMLFVHNVHVFMFTIAHRDTHQTVSIFIHSDLCQWPSPLHILVEWSTIYQSASFSIERREKKISLNLRTWCKCW